MCGVYNDYKINILNEWSQQWSRIKTLYGMEP